MSEPKTFKEFAYDEGFDWPLATDSDEYKEAVVRYRNYLEITEQQSPEGGQNMAIKQELRERAESLFREGNSAREVSKITGMCKSTAERIFRAMPDHASLKCKCGLPLIHRGRCSARRMAGSEVARQPKKRTKKGGRRKRIPAPAPIEVEEKPTGQMKKTATVCEDAYRKGIEDGITSKIPEIDDLCAKLKRLEKENAVLVPVTTRDMAAVALSANEQEIEKLKVFNEAIRQYLS